MNSTNDPREQRPLSEQDREKSKEKKESDQQKSDPPLTEIKGVTEPEEYVEPPVEDEPEK